MGVLAGVIGMLVVVATGASMAATFVLPRGRSKAQKVAFLVNRGVRAVTVAVSRPIHDFGRKDGVLATIGPMALLAQLFCFLGLFFVGYMIALLPSAGSFGQAAETSAASLFTVGLAHLNGRGNSTFEVLAGVTGAIAIALQIGYLPAIYQAFNRRESLVTLIESRAGVPAWGPELLVRHQLVASVDALASLYEDWELWAADLAESHSSYPVLLFFRSPEPGFSWALSLLAVLDGAALQLALSPAAAPSQARMCLRMGFTAFRRVAQTLGWSYEKDPHPEAPLQLTYEDFVYAVELLERVGFPMERTAEEAWPHFRGWRVNYEDIAYRLADFLIAPRAPWSGDRRHLRLELMMPDRPPHRNPDGDIIVEGRYRPPAS